MGSDFSVKLDLTKEPATDEWEEYRDMIENLRELLGVRRVGDRYVLPPEELDRTRFQYFDVVMQIYEGDDPIRFRFRRDNLYLVAYQIENGQWQEFTVGSGRETRNPHLVDPNSGSIGFGETYQAMRNNGNIAYLRLLDISRSGLIQAVSNLNGKPNPQTRARSLMIVIIMISEAVRFRTISNLVTTRYHSPLNVDAHIESLVNEWGTLSDRVLRVYDRGEQFHIGDNGAGIVTLDQAIDELGIVKNCSASSSELQKSILCPGTVDVPEEGASLSFPRAHLEDEPDSASRGAGFGGESVLGQQLAEVFSVIINNIEGEDPGQLYGNMTVTDGLTSQPMYNVDSSDSDIIKPGETCDLTGPSRCISGYDSFTVDLDLWVKNWFSSDCEISRGQIVWNAYDFTNDYDVVLTEDFSSEYGSSTVNYAVLSNAVTATVEVTLLELDGDIFSTGYIYGIVAVRNDKLSEDINIFQRKSYNYVDVKCGELIPLWRSAVVVSLGYSLTVWVRLYDHNNILPDTEIAYRTLEFPARLNGTDKINAAGDSGKVEVQVTWSNT